jgi:hypothetical protein
MEIQFQIRCRFNTIHIIYTVNLRCQQTFHVTWINLHNAFQCDASQFLVVSLYKALSADSDLKSMVIRTNFPSCGILSSTDLNGYLKIGSRIAAMWGDICHRFNCRRVFILNVRSDLPRLSTGPMLILECFSVIICMIYT